MRHFGRFCKMLQISGHAIIEPRSDADQQVTVVKRHIRCVCAVHPRHSQKKRMVCRETAQTEERVRYRNLLLFGIIF